MTLAEFQAEIAKHGGLLGKPIARNPTIKGPGGIALPNPNPTYRYIFADGKYADAVAGTGADGSIQTIDPVGGNAFTPPKSPASSNKVQTFTDPQTGQVYQLDPNTQQWAPATGLPAAGETPAAQNADTAAQRAAAAADLGQQRVDVSGQRADISQQQANTAAGRAFASTAAATDPYILSIDPTTGQMTQQNNPNYDPTIRSDQRDQLTRQAAQDQLAQTQRDLQNQIALGQLSDTEARQAFQDQYDMLTAGLNAGQEAVKNAQLGTVNRVGPNFGANFAAAVNGVARGDTSQVHFSPGDFSYPMPDYQAIAQKATAAAIAHLSPYAAHLTGRAAPAIPAYAPPPAPPAAPSVVQAAANSVVSSGGQQQAPPAQVGNGSATISIPPYQPGRPQ